jgi:hypothetical protein
MDIVQVFREPGIRLLEDDLIRLYDHPHKGADEHVIKHLLEQRHRRLRTLQVYDDDIKSMLIGFNDRLRSAASTLYNRVKTISEDYRLRENDFGEYEVEGKMFLGFAYPQQHPIQDDKARTIWEILTQGGYYPLLYESGCTWSLCVNEQHPITECYDSLEDWLGFSSGIDNWNEGLDSEWSKDMHLIYPFHNLYEHLGFSLYDLIYVDTFNIEVNVKFEDDIRNKS